MCTNNNNSYLFIAIPDYFILYLATFKNKQQHMILEVCNFTSERVQRLPTTASSITLLSLAPTKLPIWSHSWSVTLIHNTLVPPDQISDNVYRLLWLVTCSPPTHAFGCLFPSIFSIPQSYWWVIFCQEMESVWPKRCIINTHTASSYGRYMWRYSSWCFSWWVMPC